MNRRDALGTLGINLIGLSAFSRMTAGSTLKTPDGNQPLRAKDVNAHLRSLCDVRENSVDRIIVGDPETIVTKMGTTWMPYWKTCRKAVEAGVNCLVVHEPTFYYGRDLDLKEEEYASTFEKAAIDYSKLISEKKEWIERKKLVIIRCHDVLDRVSRFGIPFALGFALGYTNEQIIRSRPYYNVYEIDARPAFEIARYIAKKLKPFDQPGVAFYGDGTRAVNTVGVGTGCICNPLHFADLMPDLFIAIDDSVKTWIQTTYAEDSGHPLVVINHGTSEENGVRMLNAHLRETFPGMEVVHFDQGCGYRWITA